MFAASSEATSYRRLDEPETKICHRQDIVEKNLAWSSRLVGPKEGETTS